jgi:hypothetical protein
MTGNQECMRNSFRLGHLNPVVLLALGVPLGACSADVLAFGSGDAGAREDSAPSLSTSSTSDAQASATLAIPADVTVANLTHAQAATLCGWLRAEFESDSNDPLSGTDITMPAGYATGPSFGCGALDFTSLSAQNCEANLRAFPCTGTIGALAQCASYFVKTHDPKIDPSGNCDELAQNCDAFTQAASCGMTVFVPPIPASGSPDFYLCSGAVPISPEVGACN